MVGGKIVLFWLQASWKSTVWEELAKSSEASFRDLDGKVVNHSGYHTIPEFVTAQWEKVFRQLEHDMVLHIPWSQEIIWSLGWWTPEFERNRKILERDTIYRIFLNISPEEQFARMQTDDAGNTNRIPTSIGDSEMERQRQTYIRRVESGIYPNFSNYTINVDNKTIGEIVDEILWLEEVEQIIS